MTQRTQAAMDLLLYFEEKGRILTPAEYQAQKDTPIRFTRVKQIFGSWNRMENIVRKFNIRNETRADAPARNDIATILQQKSELEAEYDAKMRAASENVDAKTAREAAARDYVEADKLRAATAQGAYENKMRKGGVTSQNAKAKKEAIEQAVAEEHAMLAKTGVGAALGKELLGGVEDNDEKTRVIELQNAFREKTKLMAATPLGAAEAKLTEDDTDGQLSRESQARIRNELRTYVPPVAEGNVEQAQSEGLKKVRDEVRKVVESAASDENIATDSVFKASAARAKAQPKDLVEIKDVSSKVSNTMPPADQPAGDNFVSEVSLKDKDGNTKATLEKTDEEGTEEMTSEAAENKNNPEATPADRNPDPKLLAEDKAAAPKPATKPAAKK